MSEPKRYYDDKRRKRGLFVSITSWRGISIGAKHWYAEVREDSNPIVLPGKLVGSLDDPGYAGRTFGGILDTNFPTFESAVEWAIQTIRDEFHHHKLMDVSGSLISFSAFKRLLKSKEAK